ncbi:MAG: response regulator [Deltaproteobacteria bacterium]|nr:response regulator [Deltaproteobacteria bacterium]
MSETILIVDDEPDILDLLELIIADKTDYRVVTTTAPREALEMIRGGGVDLLITDLRMPEMDGSDLVSQAGRIDDHLPFIVITAYGTPETALEVIRLGAFDFITKPFRQEQILLTIEKAIKFRRLQQENQALRAELEALKKQESDRAARNL